MILFVFIVGCEKSTSPGIASKINGTVHDPSGNPVADAKILVNFHIDSEYPIESKDEIDQFINKDSKGVDDPPGYDTTVFGNYPNPFSSITTIVFQLGSSCMLSLSIESLRSEEIVRIIDNDSLAAHAMYSVAWDGKNNDNKNIQNGAYKVVLHAGDETCDDSLFIFKDYKDFIYETISPLSTSDAAGHFTIFTQDLPLNYVGDHYDIDGCLVGDFSVTPYIDIWAFHADYAPVHIDSVLIESGHDINVTLTFE
ncbi:MAG: hypothetical protein P9L89_00055 [Candidatus Celaenobacter polaris]|nr:hypothetical protein [Candidatus Celaenobacter polaris]